MFHSGSLPPGLKSKHPRFSFGARFPELGGKEHGDQEGKGTVDQDHVGQTDGVEQEARSQQDDLKTDPLQHIAEGKKSSVIFLRHLGLKDRGRRRENAADRKSEQDKG